MHNSIYDLKREELERIFHQQPKPTVNKLAFASKISRILQQMIASLTKAPEPRIGTVKDSFGKTVWCVYDPITGQSARLASETEVRIWLEERYYAM
ncbi:hypothetical protein H6F98_10600 [Microcoleus sp. FACHB-SPT15]|uniref:hypothetical protein n=1 Tax=Microcoleus sp. FACHB-SPT15 TaxID=2692830 RepID=UPI00177F141A|nr:hypothetical protein [Microcoleus sp. FACHB-SPT15]MBD1805898.1 hypothetical protein [Microcoleus sp. FACHB-SPT15]